MERKFPQILLYSPQGGGIQQIQAEVHQSDVSNQTSI